MREKGFDCVRMKDEIQQKILQEMAGLSPEDWRNKTEEHILADPILGPFWRRAKQIGTTGRPTPQK